MDRVKKLTKAQLLTEYQRISKDTQTTKGTYIKTMKHEDIFEIPVNKTSTIHQIKGPKGKKMLIPVEDDDEDIEAGGIMSNEEVEHLIKVLKNPHSKEILRAFLKQEEHREKNDSSSSSDSD
jgi:hypothetical protein